MKITYTPNTKKIKTILPGSKSISNRLLLIAAVGNFLPDFKNLSKCEDVQVLNAALHSNTNVLNVRDSGTALRFLTAFMSGIVGEWVITGSERLQQRPIKPLVDVLKEMGANIVYNEKPGYAPLTITGTKMKGGDISIDISESSQYASAILLIAPMLEKGLKLRLEGKKRSLPYIDITINMMKEFGIKIMKFDDEIDVLPNQEYTPIKYTVEADWSAAAFWYELIALKPDTSAKLLGLDPKSFQGDKAVISLFKKLGVETHIGTQHITLTNTQNSNKSLFKADIRQTPDLFPALALTCFGQGRPFEITGTANLALKESHRLEAVRNIGEKLGIKLHATEDSIAGQAHDGKLTCNEEFSVVNDHRIAMALAPLSVLMGEVNIDKADVVSKSYPEFWDDMRNAGVVLEE